MVEERIEIAVGDRAVDGAWAKPEDAAAVLVLAHGAGVGVDHPFLVGFTRALNAGSVATLRFNFPYMQAGRRRPDPESVLREAWLAAFDRAQAWAAGRPVLVGGKSLGGRVASLLVADGMPAAGLVFLGYPLHPPGRPERLRDEHLGRIQAPMLFLQGTADSFARADLLAAVLDRLGERAALHAVEGGDHSFRVKGARRADGEIGQALAEPTRAFIHRIVGRS